jgi:putative DNA primase/helicase
MLTNAPTSISIIEQALSFIPADAYYIWILVGMALKSELGDAGFFLWDRWSSNSDNYSARDTAASWRSFKEFGGVGIGTLFHTAKQYGYQCDSNNKSTPPTLEDIAQRELKRKAETDLLASRRKGAADKAASIWNSPASALEATQPAITDHGYLKHKRIQPHGAKIYHGSLSIGGMACNNALMIPMKLNGKISSLQFISRDGEKRFLPDGEKGYYLIGKIAPDAPTCIAEGFATGASIHEATGHAVVVAFDAGNLRKIAEALRAKNPDAVIVLCADDDETGTGKRKATEAAQAVGGLLAMPIFSEGVSHE